jgi:hypothetical protein
MSVTAPNRAESIDQPKSEESPKWRWPSALFLTSLAAAAIVAPMFFLGIASGHDIQFHIASWIDVHGQWREGVLFPRWAVWANWGYGEPRFIFYPPASWILGALLGTLLPWKFTVPAFVFIALVMAGMAAWVLARDWIPPAPAVAAGALYALNPYQLANVYYRSDYAELLAFALFPLLVRGALRVIYQGWSAVSLLALPFAAIWLSNAPAAVVSTYSLSLVLVVGCLVGRNWKPLLPGATAMILGFGLAGVYIVSAAVEQRWVQIQEALSSELQPIHNFLFTKNAEPEFLLFNLKISFLALGMVFLTFLAAVFASRRRRQFPELWWAGLALAVVSTVLMFPSSEIVWRSLPKLQFVQFPWRWLEPLGLVFALFAAASFEGSRIERRLWLGTLALVIACAGIAMGRDTWWDTEDANYILESVREAKGYEGTDEYVPVGCDRYVLPDSGPRVALLDLKNGKLTPTDSREIRVKVWKPERIELDFEARSPETLVLRKLNYPAWKARFDGQPIRLEGRPKTGEMELSLAEGRHRVEIWFGRTADRTAGVLISLVSALGLAGLEIAARKRKQERAG